MRVADLLLDVLDSKMFSHSSPDFFDKNQYTLICFDTQITKIPLKPINNRFRGYERVLHAP